MSGWRGWLLITLAHGSRPQLRGIDGFEDEFPYGNSPLDDALTFCDLTTGPDGAPITLEHRVAEINERYGPDTVTARAITMGAPGFAQACARTLERVARAGIELDRISESPVRHASSSR